MTTQYPAIGSKWKERDVRVARTVEIFFYDVAKRRVRIACLDLQDAAGYVCPTRDLDSANGDDEDEEEEDEKKKEKDEDDEEDEEDEEDEDDDDDEEGAIPRLSRQARKIEQDITGLKRTGWQAISREGIEPSDLTPAVAVLLSRRAHSSL
jgi:Prothymosin/parathymosin family